MQDRQAAATFFGVFLEVGIIGQLSRAMLESHLPDGLIAPHFGVLNHLIRVEDGRTPMELARAFQVPKTSMTHTVGGLQKLGLVDVRPNPNDGRSKCVWITGKGRELRNGLIEGMGPEMERLASGFDVAKLGSIIPVLTELRIFLDEYRNAEPPRDRDIDRPVD